MSAIAGLRDFAGAPAGARCARMLAAQRLYGPDRTDQWESEGVAIGRALYRLLPEDRYDTGPLRGGGGRWTLVADVRLDDRDGLAHALGITAAARALADAALLLAAWERWQGDCFEHVAGDYAFALWDRDTQALTLARDALGGRPLHYYVAARFAAFASMAKGLHALAEVPIAPDLERNADFLALMPEAGSRSFFAGVHRVEPGHVVTITRGGVGVRRHWAPSARRESLSPDAAAEAVRAELDRAVRARLRGADAHVGAHLSAGIDSSAVASSAALAMATRGGSVTAFTAVPRRGYNGAAYPGRLIDESAAAAQTAALHANMIHVVVPQDTRTVLDDLDRNFHLFERPLANADAWHWWNRINAEAQRQGVGVMLTGAMGNMTISYAGLERLGELARAGHAATWLREAHALVATRRMRWRGVLAHSFGRWMPAALWSTLHQRRDGIRRDLGGYSVLTPALADDPAFRARARALDLDPAYRPRADAFAARLWGLQRIDFGNTRQGVLAGWGVDLRDPTSDRRLVELCLSLPAAVFLRDGEPRALARAAFGARVGAAVFADARRGYQSADWHEGLTHARDEVGAELRRFAEVPAAAALLDLPRMTRLVDEWPVDGWEQPAVEARYRFALLRGVVSGHFLRKASSTNR